MKSINIYTVNDMKGIKPNDAMIGWLIEMKTDKGPATLYHVAKLENVTSVQAQLMLLIDAMSHITEQCHVDIYTDNVFVESAFNQNWITSWVASGWITTQKKPVKHQEEWQALYTAVSYHDTHIHLVCSHEYSRWLDDRIKKERERLDQNTEETA